MNVFSGIQKLVVSKIVVHEAQKVMTKQSAHWGQQALRSLPPRKLMSDKPLARFFRELSKLIP